METASTDPIRQWRVVSPRVIKPASPPATEELTCTKFAVEYHLSEPRRWRYGWKLSRGFVTLLAGPGGVGKSALLNAEILSMSSGEELLGQRLWEGALRVLYLNTEDPLQEMQRQMEAAIRHYRRHFNTANFVEPLLLSGRDQPIVLATCSNGRWEVRVQKPAIAKLTQTLTKNKIDVLVIDPVIGVHEVNENDNSLAAKVMAILSGIAQQTGCAVYASHHIRKGGEQDASADVIRGASAWV